MGELKKNIGFFTIVALLVTALLGTGIFLIPAIAASFGGTASIFSWIIMFILSIYIAFVFGELVAMYPTAGGVYEFSKKAYGRFPSFIIGWTTWLVNTINTPLLIVAALKVAFPMLTSLYFILISVGIIVFMNFIAYRGMKDSSVLLFIFASITLVVIGLYLFKAIPLFNIAYVLPFQNTNLLMILIGVFFISETFFGWESASFLAEETENAKKVIPKALVITTIFVGLLSVIVGAVSLGIFPIDKLVGDTNAFSSIVTMLFTGEYARYFVIGIFVVFIGSASANIIATPRLLLAMARDKLFIEQFSKISSKTGTPYKAIFFQAVVGIILIFISFGNYEILLSLIIPLSFLMYFAVIITLPILRKKNHAKVDFRAPFGTWLPYVIGLLFLGFIGVWLYIEPNSAYIFRYVIGFILFGLPVYLLLNIYYNPEFSIRINEFFSYFNYKLENVFFPIKLRKEMLSVFTDYKGKTILEFGSGVGSLTTYLAEEVGSKGKIFAIDFSQKNIKILNSRLMKEHKYQVKIIYDEHMINRIHPEVDYTDMVFSVGMLGYIQDLKKILNEMYDILPEGGKVCFIEYIDYFKFIPNPKVLDNKEELVQIFKSAGFSVRVKKIKGILWNYCLIYGIKTQHNEVPFI
jgi:amino acid transporter